MHYYKFNIADWNLATNHLSLEEEAVYFKLVNYYYDTESPIPEETQMVIRRLRLGSHIKTVELILNEFFVFSDGSWHHARCDEELFEYQKKANNNRENGKKGGRPKKINDLENNPEITQMVSENNPDITLTINHKPLTINHELIKNKKKVSVHSLLSEYGITDELAEDFITHRKSKKDPITKTVLNGIQKEAGKAGLTIQEAIATLMIRGWRSFKAEWIKEKPQKEELNWDSWDFIDQPEPVSDFIDVKPTVLRIK